tara:strand:- start:282 stop:722 length:441 start_codon:yes stop_codon:yes gene_type:complete
MAREIRLGDIGDYANTQMEKLLKSAVLDTDTLLKSASPVDTGRFRASWQVGENAAGAYDAGPQQEATGAYKDQTEPPGKPTPPALRRMNYSKERPGNIYSVHNNLPYAEPLANGSSKQANAGWVQGIAKDVQGRVIAAAARIGRES